MLVMLLFVCFEYYLVSLPFLSDSIPTDLFLVKQTLPRYTLSIVLEPQSFP